VAKLHHSAIATRDVEVSSVLPTLFGGETTTLRSVFLGETASPESEIVDLDTVLPHLAALDVARRNLAALGEGDG
jgi:hypothetical protein